MQDSSSAPMELPMALIRQISSESNADEAAAIQELLLRSEAAGPGERKGEEPDPRGLDVVLKRARDKLRLTTAYAKQ
jgi:hypothetical protein